MDPKALAEALEARAAWKLVVYLLRRFRIREHVEPELEPDHWQAHLDKIQQLLRV